MSHHDSRVATAALIFTIDNIYTLVVIDNQPVKAVKFKVEVTEKVGRLTPSASTASGKSNQSNQSNIGYASSDVASSSAAAAILATVDLHSRHPHPYPLHNGNSSQISFHTGGAVPVSVKKPASSIPCRRASDGGSILSNAAAVVSNTLTAAAARNPFHLRRHRNTSSGGNERRRYPTHHHSHHLYHSDPSSPVGEPDGHGTYPSISYPSTLPLSAVKVTLHQQQGANSTLKMIFEKLQAEWEHQAQGFGEQARAIPFNSGSSGVVGDEVSIGSECITHAVRAQRRAAI